MLLFLLKSTPGSETTQFIAEKVRTALIRSLKFGPFFLFAGLDEASYDPQRFAMDYHIIGFRECVAEVARYLVSIEGMDVQDPLRLRLMSHLQCFLTQRELSSKANASPAWSHSSSYQPAYPPHSTTYYHQNYAPQSASSSVPYIPQVATMPPTHDQTNLSHATAHQVPPHTLHASAYATSATASAHDLYSSQHDASSANHQQQSQQSQQQQQQQQSQSGEQNNPTYTDISNLHPNRGGYGNTGGYAVSTSTHGYSPTSNSYNSSSSKPYRPWGAEMAC